MTHFNKTNMLLQYRKQQLLAWAALFVIAAGMACSDFLEVEPPKTQLVSDAVFADELTAKSAVAGLYYRLAGGGFAGGSGNSVTFLASLLADESRYLGTAGNYVEFSTHNILPTNTQVANLWNDPFAMIYYTNLIIEKLQGADLPAQAKDQLTGEALFIRAFTYFYLTNLFGDVPYTTSTDYRVNTALARAPKSVVYEGIVQDLRQAVQLLPETYTSDQRVRPVKAAAQAMLARVQLYLEDWQQAESYATEIIANTSLFELEDIENVFLHNSREAIWQLIPSNRTGNNYTFEGNTFIVRNRPTGLVLSNDFVLGDWEPDDLRKATWIGHAEGSFGEAYFPYKYKENSVNASGVEYSMVIRLAEILLIRAEARVHSGDLEGARADLNAVRARAGLVPLTSTVPNDLIAAIARERKHELFTEWGHRWFDLVRTGKASEVLGTQKPGWTDNSVLLPVPESELLVNKNLIQNPGF